MGKTHEDRIAIVEKENEHLKNQLSLVFEILAKNGLLVDTDECTVNQCAKRAKIHPQTVYKHLREQRFANTFKQQGKNKIIFYRRFISVLQEQA